VLFLIIVSCLAIFFDFYLNFVETGGYFFGGIFSVLMFIYLSYRGLLLSLAIAAEKSRYIYIESFLSSIVAAAFLAFLISFNTHLSSFVSSVIFVISSSMLTASMIFRRLS
jgi:hypothetical protein